MTEHHEQRKIKLIWEFHGPDAARTATHHEIHLKEYIKNNDLDLQITGVEPIDSNFSRAYMVIHEEHLQKTRQALKPHRGQVYQEKK